MPELPEVETIRLLLQSDLIGKTIKDVTVMVQKQFVGNKADIIGKKIDSLIRKGKVVSIKLDNGLFISFHLKLSGQLLFAKDKYNAVFANTIPLTSTNKMPGKTTSIILDFTDGSALFFNDLRKFGWMKIGQEPEGPKSVDVLSPDFTQEFLQTKITKSKKPIKTLLMDQEALAGIGNIYANDSLYEAKINPERKASTLTTEEINALYASIKKVIAKGLQYRGSSAKDEIYILPDGSKGTYQNHFRVYHREGQPCGRCENPIKRIKQGGRSSFYCPMCQQ